MTTLRERLRSSEPLLWLDATAYAAQLLARGQVPWLDTTEYIAWQRKTQQLLDSEVIGLPLAQLNAAWLHAHADLRTAMTAKRRRTHALRTLLSDEPLRRHAAGLAADLRAMFADRPLALLIPSPRAWVAAAHALAHETAEGAEVDDDDADAAAAYIADFLRSFANCAIDVLLLQQAGGALHDPSHVPIGNLAAHYRWDLGIHSSAIVAEAANDAVSFVIAPPPNPYPIAGIAVPADFWFGAPAPQDTGNFLFAAIPAALEPERALERLAILRAR